MSDERETWIAEQNRRAAGRVQLRHAPVERLGAPSRVEVWRGAECIGFIYGTSDGIEIVPNGARRLAPDGGRVVLSLRVEFTSDAGKG